MKKSGKRHEMKESMKEMSMEYGKAKAKKKMAARKKKMK